MALVKVLVAGLVGAAAGQQAWALPETTTPVPILRYIDSQNADGSYTYGFEGADGTYKLETRLATGEVRGKYGYYDPDGVLREASYGATKEGGFEPKIQGLVLPTRTLAAPVDPRLNEVAPAPVATPRFSNFNEVAPAAAPVASRRFSNFSRRKAAGETRRAQPGQQEVKIVNGRRALLKRRLVKRPPTARPEEVARGEVPVARGRPEVARGRPARGEVPVARGEGPVARGRPAPRSRARQLATLRAVAGGQRPAPRAESFRSLPALQPAALVGPVEPYVTHGAEFGSYSISY